MDSDNLIKYIFLIPNHDNHGAQNFMKRLFESLPVNDKNFFIEDDFTFFELFFLIRRAAKNKRTVIISTVNSNILGLFLKIFSRQVFLISRLGNTISRELSKNTFKYFVHKIFYLLLIKYSNAMIFQSIDMKNDFINFFEVKDTNNLHIIHNGIDSNQFYYKENIRSGDKVKFLLVGTFKAQKGYDIFFSSFKYLPSHITENSQFRICGNGDLLKNFKQYALSLKNADINFEGMVDPKKFYPKADIFLSCSRFEGFSNALIEALSFGTPCIVSDCPSANREVINNSNGIFFENENPSDLAEKICYMYENFKGFNRQKISSDTIETFNIKKISNQYLDLSRNF